MNKIQIAKIALEANRSYCEQRGEMPPPAWEDASEELRESLISGVAFILHNPASHVSAQHERWCENRWAAGWKWGEVKDYDAKTHPCLIDFDLLPVEQQAKDILFRNIVMSFIHFAKIDE
jgi:RyR domain